MASNDWWASRIVVSVISSRFSLRIHSANFSGPSSCSFWRVPAGGTLVRGTGGGTGAGSERFGSKAPFTSGRPFTMTSPRYDSVFVARSRLARKRNSAGVWSMKVVVASPDLKVGCSMRFSRNEMFVLTPRMRNSRSARSER